MALFCYLTHILRDLPEDAQGNPQLLTIPDGLLAGAGLTLEAFAAAARDHDHAALAPVTSFLLERAEHYGGLARADLAELAPRIGSEAVEILQHLFERYVTTFGEVRARYG